MGWKLLGNDSDGVVAGRLARVDAAAATVCWYPGSYRDLVPLLLAIDDSVFGRALYQEGRTQDRPMVLWMSDPEVLREAADPPAAFAADVPYEPLWKRLGATHRVTGCACLTQSPARWLVDVEVSRSNGTRQGFTLVLSEGTASEDFHLITGALELRIDWVILIAQACTRLYREVPRLFAGEAHRSRPEREQLPEAFIVDPNAHWENYFARSVSSHYRRVFGGGVRGWGQGSPEVARLLARLDRWDALTCRLPNKGEPEGLLPDRRLRPDP